jgi:predicted CopG family antitoxin
VKIIRSINIEESIWKKLQELAKKENRSASNLLEVMIKNWEKGE